MTSSDESLSCSDNAGRHRFELHVAGQLAAYAEYNVLKNGLLLTHTEVLPAFEGRGIGSAIARHALESARQQSLSVIPVCQFMAAFLRKHPEYQDLVTLENRRAFRI
ncbi:MAG TPA: GNAT family N-acetyltransferase [Ramlibacter sp.]|uniref:GNAT family N-acetyltransferase n=1 Tax=Ramlibacter sp. TaxID=1917967 RepID=UPI002D7F40BB|nr:GNAT family N-acetyltransferase [Ramlibacter sp.]HET8745872.1 GNAT family N-acetyltransferase [Ramlibacter sp.]